jgi:tetratricopeptide (TPR) repeat protein
MGTALEAEGAEPSLFEQIAADLDNLRLALAWGTRNDPLAAAEACSALGEYWNIRGGASEALRLMESLPLADVAGENRPKLLGSLVVLRWSTGDLAGAGELEEERYALAVEMGSDELLAMTLDNIANFHWVEGDLDKAIDLYRQALGFAGTGGADYAAHNLAVALVDAGRLAEADQLMGPRIEEWRADPQLRVQLARLRIEQGELHESANALQESIAEIQAIGGSRLATASA